MKRLGILIIAILMIIGMHLFAEGTTEMVGYVESISGRTDAVSLELQEIAGAHAMENDPLKIEILPLSSETYVFGAYPDMKARRYDYRLMKEQVLSLVRHMDDVWDAERLLDRTFIMIMRYDKDRTASGPDSYTIDDNFFNYVFLDNDKGNFLRVQNHCLEEPFVLDETNNLLAVVISFGESWLNYESELFLREAESLSITINAFGLEGKAIEFKLPLGGLFNDIPEAPKQFLDRLRSDMIVSFHGTDIPPLQGQSFNATIEEPVFPTREGYTFGGWYVDKEFFTKWDFSTDRLRNDLALHAKWEKIIPPFKIANGKEPEDLDPQMIQDVPEHRIYKALFEGLVAYDPETATAVPGLAESWTISEDGTQYTFTLRDATWSDGVPITAQSFVDSWIRELDPATGAPYAWFPSMFLEGAAEFNAGEVGSEALGVRAINDKTLEVELIGPMPYVLGALGHYSFAVVPMHAIEKYGDEWTFPENFVGNGPFTLKEWVPQAYIKVVPNEKYWDRVAVNLDEVFFYAIDDNNTAYNMYLNDEVDWLTSVPLDQIETASMHHDYHRASQLSTYYYTFQTEKVPFDDARVRKALSMSFDRQALVDQVTRAGQIPAWGIVPEIAGYPGLGEPTYDVAQARKLLAEAGYPNGTGFPETAILYNTSAGHKAIAKFLQQEWKNNLNITLELENQEWATYLSNRYQGNFQIARAGWVGDYQDPNTFLDMFITGAGMNGGKYSNEIYDLLIREATTMSGSDRMEVLNVAEDILINEDMAVMPMYYYTTNNMIDTSKWGGWHANTMDYHPLKDIYRK